MGERKVASTAWLCKIHRAAATAPPGGNPQVKVLNPSAAGATLASFFAGPADRPTGARLAVLGGRLLVGSGPGSDTTVRAYTGLSQQGDAIVRDPNHSYGVFVG